MHTNEQFIKALNRKKEEAFQMLFKDYYASLVMYAMHYVRQEVAEDIVQDLMTLLWEKDTYFDLSPHFIRLSIYSSGIVRSTIWNIKKQN